MNSARLEAPPDAGLVEAFRDGDEAALAALYDRHMPGVYDFLARYVRDPVAAEDLTQMTFIRAWERRSTLREAASFRAWLFRIARNLGTNHLNRARQPEAIEDQPGLAAPGPGPEESSATREVAELVWAAAASLEPRQYAVLDLCLRRDLSSREVAEVLGVPAGHAAVLVNRAREALGNAVRYLLVARRRDHCERLAALVPAGLRSLTPEQRSAVDHHMRRCPQCQGLARRLTSPAELFGGLVALPVPSSLKSERREFVLTSSRRLQEQMDEPGPAARSRRWLSRRALTLGALALLVLAALLTARYLYRPAPSTPVHLAVPAAEITGGADGVPSPSPSTGAPTDRAAGALPVASPNAPHPTVASPSTSPLPSTPPASTASPSLSTPPATLPSPGASPPPRGSRIP